VYKLQAKLTTKCTNQKIKDMIIFLAEFQRDLMQGKNGGIVRLLEKSETKEIVEIVGYVGILYYNIIYNSVS